MIFFEGYPVGWEGCKGSGGGPGALVLGGVGGRGTGPRDGANSGGVPTGAGLVDRAVNQGPWGVGAG